MKNNRIKLAKSHIHKLLDLWHIDPTPNTNRYVFFDVDGTLSRQDNFSDFIHTLSFYKIIPAKPAQKLIKARREYKKRRWKFSTYIKHVVQTRNYLKLLPKWLFDNMVDTTFKEFQPTYYTFTYLFLKRLQKYGYKLIAVSGSPDFILKKYFKYINLQVDDIWSTKYIFKNGIFTGKVDLSAISDKGKYVKKMSKKYNFSLKNSIGIGDTGDDITMLNTTQFALGVNPNIQLATYTRKHNIPIVIERKDLIILVSPEWELL